MPTEVGEIRDRCDVCESQWIGGSIPVPSDRSTWTPIMIAIIESYEAPEPVPEPIERRRSKSSKAEKKSKGLGDTIESALLTVGITEERVTKFLGRPCGCKERKERWNAIGAWAARVVSGKIENAKEYLERIIDE